jgi:hypothetical protein
MSAKNRFTVEEAKEVGKKFGIDWSKFNVEQFKKGIGIELEHELVDSGTSIFSDDPIITGEIALAHLNEFPDYYTRLCRMEKKAEKFWKEK